MKIMNQRYKSANIVKKCDISALVQTIEEIENKLKMQSILINKEISDDVNVLGESFMDDLYEDFLINQFSVLNFERNYSALKAHKNNDPF